MKQPQKRTSILYFDDEEMCLDVFRQFFEDEYEVRVTSKLKDARAALMTERFDIVISDQLMPETDGLTFLREVAQHQPQAFRVMLTGSVSLGQVISEICTGTIHLFVTKPWSEPDMRQILERAGMSATNRIVPHPPQQDQLVRNAA